ncbi:CRISPR-associated helicase/endonuclease Cas3, partial [bacterium]|nr:CRISPR-associated helicase/endonuclease Cas3 [bacterium]
IESHSGVNFEDDDDKANYKRLAAENWDAPIIVTTAVQFLESLFANKPSKCRKLHNIANSVIIFDEAQMMPIKYLRPTLMAIEGLVRHFQCSIVMCSATQPNFQRFVQDSDKRPNLEKFLTLPFGEIMEEDKLLDMYRSFQRVTFQDDGKLTYEDVAQKINACKQVLCIAATKSEAKKIYDALDDSEVIYLSTNLCPVHRKKVIDDIKERLKNKKDCKVVSTSVISVGVDVDFPVVFLERVGLDSLIQGAGRCNREGENSCEDSIVHIFDTEDWVKNKFMKLEKRITNLFPQELPDVDWGDPQSIEYYFNNLYACKNLDKEEPDKNIICLTSNSNFAKVDENYRIIIEDEDGDNKIFIPLTDEAREIEDLLRGGSFNKELMRRANQYIVSVRNYDYLKLKESGAIECLDENDKNFAVLVDSSQYDGKIGLIYNFEPKLITV